MRSLKATSLAHFHLSLPLRCPFTCLGKGQQLGDSVAVEAAEFASAEAVVGGLGVRVVRDYAVVACLGGRVRCDDGTHVSSASACRHASGHRSLHF